MFAQGYIYELCDTCYNLYNRMNDHFTMKEFIGPGKESEEEAEIRLYQIGKNGYPRKNWNNEYVFEQNG